MKGTTPEEQLRLAELRPEVLLAYQAYRAECEGQGIRVFAIVTYRSPELQKLKHAEKKSTQDVGWHQLRRAIDEQIWDPASKRWDHKAMRTDLYLRRARIAQKHGFRQIGFSVSGAKNYIGEKQSTWDPFHIEFRAPHLTLAAAIAEEAPELVA